MPHVKFVLERLLINPKMGQIKIICSENSNWHLWDIVSNHCVLETNEQVRKSLLKTKKAENTALVINIAWKKTSSDGVSNRITWVALCNSTQKRDIPKISFTKTKDFRKYYMIICLRS